MQTALSSKAAVAQASFAARPHGSRAARRAPLAVRAAAVAGEVPSPEKRTIMWVAWWWGAGTGINTPRGLSHHHQGARRASLGAQAAPLTSLDALRSLRRNLLLLGAVGAPAVGLAGPFALFFVPPRQDQWQCGSSARSQRQPPAAHLPPLGSRLSARRLLRQAVVARTLRAAHCSRGLLRANPCMHPRMLQRGRRRRRPGGQGCPGQRRQADHLAADPPHWRPLADAGPQGAQQQQQLYCGA